MAVALVCICASGCVWSTSSPPPAQETAEEQEVLVSLIGLVERVSDASFDIRTIDGVVEGVYDAELFGQTLHVGDLVQTQAVRNTTTSLLSFRSGEILSAQKIHVLSPQEGATVTSPIFIQGYFPQTFGGITWSLETIEGRQQEGELRIVEGSNETFVPFRLELFPPSTESNTIRLSILPSANPKQHEAYTQTVRLLSLRTSTLTLFFGRTSLGCGVVEPVTRVISETSSLPRAAMGELLFGPTNEELEQGITSALGTVSVSSVIIQDGVALVHLSAPLPKNTCQKATAEAQITSTLLAIPFVTEVKLLVDAS